MVPNIGYCVFFIFKDEEQVLKDAKTTIKISANFYFHIQFNGIFEDNFRQLIDLLKQLRFLV